MLHQAVDADFGTPPRDRTNRADRKMTVLIHARVSQGGRDGICRIRNISDNGLAIETSCPLTVDQSAFITLSSGRTLDCLIRWSRDGRTGMSCAENVCGIMQEEVRSRVTAAAGPALPRFYRNRAIVIAVHGRIYRCTLDSLSTHDILLTGSPSLQTSEQMMVDVPDMGSFPATICISDGGDLFARFTPALPFHLLDGWLAASQC